MSAVQIPKIIHQIWVGGHEMPEHCKQFVQEMKELNPDYEHKLWGNEIFTEVYKDDPFLQNYIQTQTCISGLLFLIELECYC